MYPAFALAFEYMLYKRCHSVWIGLSLEFLLVCSHYNICSMMGRHGVVRSISACNMYDKGRKENCHGSQTVCSREDMMFHNVCSHDQPLRPEFTRVRELPLVRSSLLDVSFDCCLWLGCLVQLVESVSFLRGNPQWLSIHLFRDLTIAL